MDLPDEFPETPYVVTAFRVSHIHVDDPDIYPGTLVLELAGRLQGTEAEVTIPFEMPVDTVIGVADELLHQYRCLAHGLPDYDDEEP